MPSPRAICQSAPPGRTSPARRGPRTTPPRIGTIRRCPSGMAPRSWMAPTATSMSQTWRNSGVASMAGSQKIGNRQQGGEVHAGRLKGPFGAFLAVDHGYHTHHHGAVGAHGFDRPQRGGAGGGDVLEHDDALAGEALVRCQPLDQLPGAVILDLLAHEKRSEERRV